MKIITLSDGIYHITDGKPESSMLYRYNVLTNDDSFEHDNGVDIDDRFTFNAKRDVDVAVEKKKKGFIVSINLSENERLFGVGDATRKTVKMRGQSLIMNVKNVASYGPMTVLLSTDGWAFVLNSTYKSLFDCGKTDKDKVVISVSDGEVDFYLFKADSLKGLIGKVTEITGKPIMLPKFAYGLTFVQNEYTDARSMLWDINTLRSKNIPCDTMGLEPNWMSKYYDFSVNKKWDKEKFPFPSWYPENSADQYTFFYPMREMGMQLSLWLCEEYDLFYAEDNNFKKDTVNEFTEDAVILDDNFSKDVRMDEYTKLDEPWFEHLKKFVDNGAAAFKLDGSHQVLHHPDRLWGGKYTDDEAHNIYPVIMAKQMSQGFREYTDRRLLLYTSGAYTGTQKYAATWAGDTGGGQNTLPSILNYAMCGHSNTSCDVDISPEGLHYGFLLPWAQYFCWANWMYPWFLGEKLEGMVRYYANLRSSLVPYIYTMAHKANESGLPILRPLPLMYEDTDKFDDVKNAYMLGDNLYVGVFDMNLNLPEGRWIDYFTGEIYEGNISYNIPEGRGGALFVKEGSVFVTMKPQKYVLEKQHDYIINVYPGKDSSFSLYEDDGFTYDYEKGIFATTLIETKNSSENGFSLVIHKREGGFDGRPDNGHDIINNSIPSIKPIQPEKDMTVEVVGKKPSAILFENKEVEFEFDGKKTIFTAPTQNRGEKDLHFEIKY